MKPKHYIIPIIFLCVTVIFLMTTVINRNQEITNLTNSMTDYNFIISNQIKTIATLEEKLSRTQLVKISFYHPASRGINSDEDPTNTATMTKPIAWRTAAVSDELFNAGWLGSKIYVNGLGIFIAEDRMNSSVSGKQIDICVRSEKKAFSLGIKHDVMAVKL